MLSDLVCDAPPHHELVNPLKAESTHDKGGFALTKQCDCGLTVGRTTQRCPRCHTSFWLRELDRKGRLVVRVPVEVKPPIDSAVLAQLWEIGRPEVLRWERLAREKGWT